jgi:hypothetical protein
MGGRCDDERGDTHAVPGTSRHGIDTDDRPAEEATRREHVEMDERMHRLVLHGPRVQAGEIQQHQTADVDGQNDDRCGDDRERAAVEDP